MRIEMNVVRLQQSIGGLFIALLCAPVLSSDLLAEPQYSHLYTENNLVHLTQEGNLNSLEVSQQGSLNTLTASQTGSLNSIEAFQYGAKNLIKANRLGIKIQ